MSAGAVILLVFLVVILCDENPGAGVRYVKSQHRPAGNPPVKWGGGGLHADPTRMVDGPPEELIGPIEPAPQPGPRPMTQERNGDGRS